jgi:hypothetical protein
MGKGSVRTAWRVRRARTVARSADGCGVAWARGGTVAGRTHRGVCGRKARLRSWLSPSGWRNEEASGPWPRAPRRRTPDAGEAVAGQRGVAQREAGLDAVEGRHLDRNGPNQSTRRRGDFDRAPRGRGSVGGNREGRRGARLAVCRSGEIRTQDQSGAQRDRTRWKWLLLIAMVSDHHHHLSNERFPSLSSSEAGPLPARPGGRPPPGRRRSAASGRCATRRRSHAPAAGRASPPRAPSARSGPSCRGP